jgi:iron complex transport system substrate-binding protein
MIAANWMPELLELAGAVGMAAPGRPSAYQAWEQVVAFRPDVLLIMPCGFVARRAASESQALKSAPGWSDLPAERAGRVYAVDANAYFNRAGPRIVESLELLAHLLHPERFPQSDLAPELWPGKAFICLTDAGE